ncbi:MAG: V-type ATP synthase subunit F [Candidatus Gygaella obscura]|nr:V-type ATP synthase subunit F [Candidatus Gygaella obscura]
MSENNLTQENFAVLGREDRVVGFKAIGFTVYIVEENDDISDNVKKIVASETKICLVEEVFFIKNKEAFLDYKEKEFPIFIPFSNKESKDSIGEIIKNIRLKAIGKI